MRYHALPLCGAVSTLALLALTSAAVAQDRGSSDRGSGRRAAADRTTQSTNPTYMGRIVRVEPERRMFVLQDMRPEGGERSGTGTGTGAGARGTGAGGTG